MSAVETLAPIGLDDLVARAALMARIDRKYVVPVGALDPFVERLAVREPVQVLEIDGRREALYDSLYYDTDELTTYHLAAHKRRKRFKVRHRRYVDSGAAFLEVKTRGGRGSTVKERIEAASRAGSRLAAGEFVDDALERAGLDGVPADDLHPTLRTVYRRTTLFLPASTSRVTIDTGLAWSLPGGPEVALEGLAVVETKSGCAASAADRLLWQHRHRPVRISKFCTGLAVLRPDLPATRWRPVLRRYVLPALPSTHPAGRPATGARHDDRMLTCAP